MIKLKAHMAAATCTTVTMRGHYQYGRGAGWTPTGAFSVCKNFSNKLIKRPQSTWQTGPHVWHLLPDCTFSECLCSIVPRERFLPLLNAHSQQHRCLSVHALMFTKRKCVSREKKERTEKRIGIFPRRSGTYSAMFKHATRLHYFM